MATHRQRVRQDTRNSTLHAKVLDVERVTRKFYDRFKLAHAAFSNFITGIEAQADREWYASLMLNRLMFIYFIQRKGFLDTHMPGKLDGDPNYLSNHLRRMQEERGANETHSFYRHFLLRLFHDGLSKREHSPELEQLLGKVPYLNIVLFDLHILERDNPEINISDEVFEKLFSFFDEYEWHLDSRPPSLRNDREINPDVLGYICEKYINQKQMGAYYTKEDITEYISKNTILPYIFNAAQQQCPIAFRPDGPVWSLLRENPDAYIYDALKKGCDLDLPAEIEVGVHDVSLRSEWNKRAPEEYALPTEIWREVVARRTRYGEVRAKLAAGEVTAINDLITYNLDIRHFAEDVIAACEDANLLRALYDSIQSVTVLDPTCGSGAFLFAALNILETLYEACLERMQDMIEGCEVLDAVVSVSNPDILYFREILNRVRQHPSRAYFIYKSIITNNLYGVDIMEEAIDICKLRLFLKLVSQVEQFDDIEPLPDIDFNIRTGNTLVGFASQEEISNGIAQDSHQQSHRPFHWWVDFSGIMKRGGFDVIIGNPPYVEYSKVKADYTLQGYVTEPCGNLYAFVIERSLGLLHAGSRLGMIVPHSSFCTDRMEPLMRVCSHSCSRGWVSTYCIRPAKLFAGVDQRLAIFVSEIGAGPVLMYSSQYHRWWEEARPALFSTLEYADVTGLTPLHSVPKMQRELEKQLWLKIHSFDKLKTDLVEAGTAIYFHNAPRYWIRAMTFAPYFWNERDGEQLSTQVKTITLADTIAAEVVTAVINSSLFYWWFIVLSDSRHLNMREIEHFPLGLSQMHACLKEALVAINRCLMADYQLHAARKEAHYQATGKVVYDEFYPRHSRPIIDEIDRVLAQHYGFTDEELDFIVNYDIKYRVGHDGGDEDVP